jgi:DNA repair exonuclease SbcCD ATPase subunit
LRHEGGEKIITFKTIQWKNFLSTGNTWTKVDLDQHLNTLIVGDNGTGKSTILDALTFSLFGKPFRKINKPQLVNTVNDGDCLVEVSFTIGTISYVVRRGIKPAVFDILVNGQPLDQTANIRDFQELLESQILRLNYKSFTQVVILGSSTFVPFMQLSAANRRDVIEDLLGIQIFSAMNTILKQKGSLLKDDISENDTNVSLKEQFVKLQTETLRRIEKDNQKIISRHQTDVKSLSKKMSDQEDKIQKTQTEIGPLEAKIVNLKNHKLKFKDAEKIDGKLQTKNLGITRELDFYNKHDECPTCQQDIDSQFKEEKTNTLKTKETEIVKAREDMTNMLMDIEEEITHDLAVVDQIQDLKSEINSLTTKISATKQIIKTLNDNIKELSAKGDVDKVKEEVEQATQELDTLNAEKEKLTNQNEVHRIAATLLKDSGIKTLIIKQYLPIMNSLINKYLVNMDFFVNFNLDEGFNETIKSRHRDEFSYESFSEGEKMRIDLALLFTWRTVAKLKNSTNTNLLVLDEVFDSSLDDTGTQEFLKILYTLGKDQNVFVISHKGDVLQDKFNNIIKFEKIKGFSRIA